jgi:hypothetical protein
MNPAIRHACGPQTGRDSRMTETLRCLPLKIGGVTLHASLTPERILDAARRQTFGTDDRGFCVACGAEAEGCEPDARRYPCAHCGQYAVYGAEELLIRTSA